MATPKIGDRVVYFRNSVNGEPQIADVMAVYNDYLVSLVVWDQTAWRVKTSVHERNCAPIKSNPDGAQRPCWEAKAEYDARMDGHAKLVQDRQAEVNRINEQHIANVNRQRDEDMAKAKLAEEEAEKERARGAGGKFVKRETVST